METLYINNLNEKLQIKTLIDDIRECCEKYGQVIDVVARRSLRKRGQAFVVFDTVDAAQRALHELGGKDFHGKPMRVAFAKQKSYATLSHQNPHELDVLRRRRETKHKRSASSLPTADVSAKRQKVEVELPNNILFLEGLPTNCSREEVLEKFHGFPGFVDVRLFAARGVGFIEFKSENQAATARHQHLEIGSRPVKISFAKK